MKSRKYSLIFFLLILNLVSAGQAQLSQYPTCHHQGQRFSTHYGFEWYKKGQQRLYHWKDDSKASSKCEINYRLINQNRRYHKKAAIIVIATPLVNTFGACSSNFSFSVAYIH